MNEPLAIVLAGIGGALVSGAVGILSSTIANRAARRHLDAQAAESRRDRRHQAFMALLQRRHAALEAVWELLFSLEREGRLNGHQTELYVRSLMWLPPEMQNACIAILQNRADRSEEQFAAARRGLMERAAAVDVVD